MVRGGLAGRGRFTAVAWSLVAENALRCVIVAALLVAAVHEPAVHGLALVAGGLVAVWPSAWRIGDGRRAATDRAVPARSRSSAAPPPASSSRRRS